MRNNYKVAAAAIGILFATQAAAEVILYEHDGFQGRTFNAERNTQDLQRNGFNDRASSVVVLGNQSWEVCEHANYGGTCRILRPGRYPSLNAMGMNDAVSSVRAVQVNARYDESRYAPPPPYPVYDSRRRRDERTYEANVTSARAVYGQPEQRCWVDRQQVEQRNDPNVGGAVVGAILGGVLGHQVGSGRGNDVATALGAVAGGVAGANVNRGSSGHTQDVRRCENVPTSGRVDYWDVTYNFKGQEHRIQTANPPGPVVMVNSKGEPRT
ncbi:hypothetical protein BWI17_18190 [Betaproteobacteria bacterium GR16-43]|nr:hypothetical protein BWI17_18190 [Betaproteobacteria bacterium GR16-43]